MAWCSPSQQTKSPAFGVNESNSFNQDKLKQIGCDGLQIGSSWNTTLFQALVPLISFERDKNPVIKVQLALQEMFGSPLLLRQEKRIGTVLHSENCVFWVQLHLNQQYGPPFSE